MPGLRNLPEDWGLLETLWIPQTLRASPPACKQTRYPCAARLGLRISRPFGSPRGRAAAWARLAVPASPEGGRALCALQPAGGVRAAQPPTPAASRSCAHGWAAQRRSGELALPPLAPLGPPELATRGPNRRRNAPLSSCRGHGREEAPRGRGRSSSRGAVAPLPGSRPAA